MLFLMFTILADLDYDLQITVFARAPFSVVQTILQLTGFVFQQLASLCLSGLNLDVRIEAVSPSFSISVCIPAR